PPPPPPPPPDTIPWYCITLLSLHSSSGTLSCGSDFPYGPCPWPFPGGLGAWPQAVFASPDGECRYEYEVIAGPFDSEEEAAAVCNCAGGEPPEAIYGCNPLTGLCEESNPGNYDDLVGYYPDDPTCGFNCGG
ncbi:MAG TPA: hypothetical protein VD866_28125, partial [Urbifossiella sp.]|nr:hypothetical protein [Urbifossiella sp.]